MRNLLLKVYRLRALLSVFQKGILKEDVVQIPISLRTDGRTYLRDTEDYKEEEGAATTSGRSAGSAMAMLYLDYSVGVFLCAATGDKVGTSIYGRRRI